MKRVMIQDKAGCRLVCVCDNGCEIVEQTFTGRVEMKRKAIERARLMNCQLFNRKKSGKEVLVTT